MKPTGIPAAGRIQARELNGAGSELTVLTPGQVEESYHCVMQPVKQKHPTAVLRTQNPLKAKDLAGGFSSSSCWQKSLTMVCGRINGPGFPILSGFHLLRIPPVQGASLFHRVSRS